MNGPPASHMTIGILQPAAFPDSVQSADRSLAALRQIVADGSFGAVETASTGCGATRSAASAVLKSSGLIVDFDAGAALYRSGASLCSLDQSERAQALRLVQEAIDEAYVLGAARLSLISGRDPGEHDRPFAIAALVDSILALYAYARANGDLELSLKVADRAVDKGFLIGPTLDGITVAEQVREQHPQFGLVLNLGHLALLGEDPPTAVQRAAPFLVRVHIGNCVKHLGDTHPRFGVPGGEINVPELAHFLRGLISVGYLSLGSRNVVAFEIRPASDEDPLEVIADSKRVLSAAWAQV
jgi:sugar phosphate isomerase/epimerase